MLSAISIVDDNYIYLCYTYNIAFVDWFKDVNFVEKRYV